jgi:outer membrane protein TolC
MTSHPMKRFSKTILRPRAGFGWALLFLLVWAPMATKAQDAPVSAAPPLALTLDEAIEIALVRNYVVRDRRLDVVEAEAQVREGWGQITPQVSFESDYTRNIKTANPFTGSDAGSFFEAIGLIEWLGYNELARTDENPDTSPIKLEEFLALRNAGLDAAGRPQSGSDNPFNVPNQFRGALTVSQKVFDIRSFWGVSAAKRYLTTMRESGVRREEQLLINDVRQQYSLALLSRERAIVARQSADRTARTARETSLRVSQGISPKYQRLSVEVELANIQTALIDAENQAQLANAQLKFLLGLPVSSSIRLVEPLEPREESVLTLVSDESAFEMAVNNRPDLEQTRLMIEIERMQKKIETADYYPTLDAFASAGIVGNVPDSRLSLSSRADDPFAFDVVNRGFFDNAYWDFTANAGFRLSWTLWDGLQRKNRVQQRQIAVQRAEIAHAQLEQSVRLEVEQAIRDLRTARERILTQEKNVSTAELNYDHASSRLREGVASPLEERDASELLDQSRLNYLQAVFDFNQALSQLETALGTINLYRDTDSITLSAASPANAPN